MSCENKIEAEIKIDYENNILSISNNSKFVLEVHEVPKKPKRKVNCRMVIHPKQGFIMDFNQNPEFNIDVTDFYFRLVKDR